MDVRALEGENTMGVSLIGLGRNETVTSAAQSSIPAVKREGGSLAAALVGEVSVNPLAGEGALTSRPVEEERDVAGG